MRVRASCRIESCLGARFRISSSMGVPVVETRRLPLAEGDIEGAMVSTGNPHFVIFVDNRDFTVGGRSWESVGAEICTHPAFPHQTNVEFVRITGHDEIEIRIYERGVGPTSSSGTGTCATGSAAIALRGAKPVLRVTSPGGPQTIEWHGADVMLTGPAELVLLRRVLVKAPSLPLRTKLTIPALPRGARVAVISPASYPQPDRLALGTEALARFGYAPSVGRHALAKAHQYFAGSARARLEDLHAAFLDKNAAAIFCSRGGYGCNYLLGGLDLGLIREHPKPLIGYSDMTCLQTWLLDQLGLVSFHGPLVAGDFSNPDGVDEPSLLAALSGDRWFIGESSGLRTLKPGKASGVLYGGCITLLAASLGTHYAPRSEGKLLFLEDRDVKPYQLDRLLRQLLLAGKFEGVTGFIFGEMLECVAPGQKIDLLDEVILRVLEGFDVPIATGLRSGHVSRRNVTLAFGIEAELDLMRAPLLSFLERATEK